MPRIVPVVEGPGDLGAVPAIVARVLTHIACHTHHVAAPKNANGKGNLTSAGGLERFLRYAVGVENCGAVLVVVDADDDCPKTLACSLADRARALNLPRPVVLV